MPKLDKRPKLHWLIEHQTSRERLRCALMDGPCAEYVKQNEALRAEYNQLVTMIQVMGGHGFKRL